MKHSLIIFAWCALAAHTSSGTVVDVPSHRIAGNPRNSSSEATRVWVEKGVHKVNVDSRGVILKGYDVVAYFTQKKAVKGSAKYQTSYQGAIYYFGSAGNLATFRESPSRYVPQYGGFCANGVKNKQLVDSDPKVFFIVKGKLYVCASPAAESEFRAHEDEDIVAANRNWEQLIH